LIEDSSVWISTMVDFCVISISLRAELLPFCRRLAENGTALVDITLKEKNIGITVRWKKTEVFKQFPFKMGEELTIQVL